MQPIYFPHFEKIFLDHYRRDLSLGLEDVELPGRPTKGEVKICWADCIKLVCGV